MKYASFCSHFTEMENKTESLNDFLLDDELICEARMIMQAVSLQSLANQPPNNYHSIKQKFYLFMYYPYCQP